MSKLKKKYEQPPGSFSALPHKVLDSVAYQQLHLSAKALLMEAIRQHNGTNNGRLQLSASWLKTRGWNSADTIARAKAQLIYAGLLFKTRQGGLHMGPDWFAITYLPISNASGLAITVDQYQRHIYGQWTGIKAPVPLSDQPTPPSGTSRSDSRTGKSAIDPKVGPKGSSDRVLAVPIDGDNVITMPYTAAE